MEWDFPIPALINGTLKQKNVFHISIWLIFHRLLIVLCSKKKKKKKRKKKKKKKKKIIKKPTSDLLTAIDALSDMHRHDTNGLW